MYADDSLEVTDELLEHVSAQGIVLAVDKLKSHRWSDEIGDYEIQVGWKGLQSIEDSYEPLTDLAKEIPILVDNYAQQADDQGLNEFWRKLQEGQGGSRWAPRDRQDAGSLANDDANLRVCLMESGVSENADADLRVSQKDSRES
ncbi:hypothetical protein PR002_g2911 [Phytophthora rubi]|uniref:Chromo domain-containing protein n=1 Tax=Phytophthora rubi TaxID=129364 RepID=A0A6A3NRW1_9STRA|nr:hypothetical protein PR002_g2911 [Phytophthora rubi]